METRSVTKKDGISVYNVIKCTLPVPVTIGNMFGRIIRKEWAYNMELEGVNFNDFVTYWILSHDMPTTCGTFHSNVCGFSVNSVATLSSFCGVHTVGIRSCGASVKTPLCFEFRIQIKNTAFHRQCHIQICDCKFSALVGTTAYGCMF